MGTTSLSALMLAAGRRLRAVTQVTTTANSSSTTTATATTLANYFSADDAPNLAYWVRLPSGADNTNTTAEERKVSDYVASTGVVTVSSAWTTDADNRVDSGKALQMWRLDPDIVRQACLEAIRELSPTILHAWVRDESLFVDNLLTNSTFETFSSTFTGWSNIGTPTLAQSTRTPHGTYSASIAATGAVEGIEQNILTSINLVDAVGKLLHVRGWTWDDAASSSRLRVTFDGSTYTNGTYNTGDGEWNGPSTQYINVAIPADLTEATVSCEVASGETGLFKNVAAWVDGYRIYRYTIPSTIRTLHNVYVQAREDQPNGLYVPLAGRPASGRILRLEGRAALTAPSADASTTEVDGDRAELLVLHAARSVSRMVEQFKDRAEALEDAYLAHLTRPGVKMTAPGAQAHDFWRVDPSGPALVLTS